MPSPTKWNDRRRWDFHFRLRKPVMYLIREHINMFTDLGKDWSAGPPSDYYLFVPMVYAIELELRMFELNLYVNDHNIIDKPSIREENGGFQFRALQKYLLRSPFHRVADDTWGQPQDQRGDRLDHLPPYFKRCSVLTRGPRSLGFLDAPSMEYPFYEPEARDRKDGRIEFERLLSVLF